MGVKASAGEEGLELPTGSAIPAPGLSAGWFWWRKFFLGASLLAPFLLWRTHGSDWRIWCYAVLAHGSLLFAICWPRSSLLGPIMNRLPVAADDAKIVWLTIDDGPSPDTRELSRLLKERGVSATFFLRGAELAHQPEAARFLIEDGHGVANHSMVHAVSRFWSYSPWRLRQEIDDCAEIFARVGVQPDYWFRCPAGIKNPFLHPLLARRGLHLVGWTVRAMDGIRCDAASGLSRIMKKLQPGAIILVHEGKNDALGQPASIDFILQLVREIEKKGYRFTNPTPGKPL